MQRGHTLQAEYRFEHYAMDNFKVDGLNPFMPVSNVNAAGVITASTDIFLGDQLGNYNAHIFQLSAMTRLRSGSDPSSRGVQTSSG